MNQTVEKIALANISTTSAVEHPAYVIEAVGISHIMTAVTFIPLHIICSRLMWKDKDMRNPTYQFIINLSIADVLELIPLGLYDGIVILQRLEPNRQNPFLHRLMGFWVGSAWYANAVLFVFIAFSRWIAITRNHLVQSVFTTDPTSCVTFQPSQSLPSLIPWVIIILFYAYALLIHPVQVLSFVPQYFTWVFDLSQPFGAYLHWHNLAFNLCCSSVEMGFNISSLRWVHRTRQSVQSLSTAENRRREVNLLVQCCIMGSVFTLACVMFTLVVDSALITPMYCLGLQIVWIANHCVNPLIYLCVNTRLRRALVRMVTCGKYGHYGTASIVPIAASTPS